MYIIFITNVYNFHDINVYNFHNINLYNFNNINVYNFHSKYSEPLEWALMLSF